MSMYHFWRFNRCFCNWLHGCGPSTVTRCPERFPQSVVGGSLGVILSPTLGVLERCVNREPPKRRNQGKKTVLAIQSDLFIP